MKPAVLALSALAHEGRLAAFKLLVRAGPDGLPAGEIARALDVPPNSLSTNLGILSNARLIEGTRAGRSVVYTARYRDMAALLEYLIQDCCDGSPEICESLKKVVANAHCEEALGDAN